ncbi:MAG: YciI family protein [Streptosporangiaceae bacterium]
MKQYLLSVYSVEGEPELAPEVVQQSFKDVDELNGEMQAAGAWVFAGGLHAPSTATTVRASGDEVITTDGPFAEAKEQLGGFWVLQAADLDEALAWAARATRACVHPVEVRPFADGPEA